VTRVDRVAIIGGGSLRCSMPVLGGLFSIERPQGLELRLCDLHDEAVDLFARVAAIFAEEAGTQCEIKTSASIDDAIPGANMVVLAFGLGRDRERWETWMREAQISDPGSAPALLARAVLLGSTFEAVNRHLDTMRERPIVINLVRPVSLTASLLSGAAHHLDWPAPLPDWERVPAAHSALRLVMRDSYASHSIEEYAATPLTDTFTSGVAKSEYSSRAIHEWIAQLEKIVPKASSLLVG
jgi:hypothetical protein